MFSRIDIEERLRAGRNSRTTAGDLMKEIEEILSDNEETRAAIHQKLTEGSGYDSNDFNLENLDSENIYHITDIQKICVDYRLRFLDSQFFKGDFPEEAITKIRILEKEHHTTLSGFKIMAPAKLLKLENADDPLLFAPIGNDYFYLIHKWGHDLHPLRKLMMWPFRNVENIAVTIGLVSLLLTLAFPIRWFTPEPGVGEYFFLFLFIFKSVAGLTVLYGGSKGKNFNNVIWRSKYYNA